MIKLICDKCGKEIETTFGLLDDEEIQPYKFGKDEIEYCLCEDCHDEIVEFVEKFVEQGKAKDGAK